jgi:hypothetical protein
VCWGIVVRRNHMLFLHISGRFLLTASLRWWSMSIYISYSVAIPVNYSSEFRERFEATTYKNLYPCITFMPRKHNGPAHFVTWH